MSYKTNTLGTTILLGALLLLSGCNVNSITVPGSDSTPPKAGMSVDFTKKGGQRSTVDLAANSSSSTEVLDPGEPIAFLASGKDTDGGIQRITISGSYQVTCFGDGSPTSFPINETKSVNASPGDTVSTSLLQSWTLDPGTVSSNCPNNFEEITGSVTASTVNFHGGTDTTQAFNFTMCQVQHPQAGVIPCF